jgi:hypothetical protein
MAGTLDVSESIYLMAMMMMVFSWFGWLVGELVIHV